MRYQLIACILIAAVVMAVLMAFPKWTVDDAYITFRYARNLAEHGQLTFNVGQDPVEGYTGVLLPLTIALAFRLGIPPEVATHVVGVGSFFLALILFHTLSHRLGARASIRLAFLWLLATAAFLYVHVFSGLETMLFTALLLGSALQLHRVLQTESRSLIHHSGLPISLLLLSLCRPEGAAYAFIVICVLSGYSVLKLKSLRPIIASVICLVVPGTLYFLWRWRYYGFLLPNTFYAKLSGSGGDTLRSTLVFLRQYLFLPTLAVSVAWIFSFDETLHVLRERRRQYATLANVSTIGSVIVFSLIVMGQYLTSRLEMNFSHRFYAPLYPLALLVLMSVLSPCLDALTSKARRRRYTVWAVRVGLCALCLTQTACHFGWLYRNEVPFASGYKTRLNEMHKKAGLYLRSRLPRSEWLVVHIDAGAIPFYSRLNTVDFGRLNDEYLAHHRNATIQERVDYFFAKNPGAAVFTTYDWNRVSHGKEADAIVSDARFDNYALAKKYGNSTGTDYFEFVFLRRDLLRENEEMEIAQQENALDEEQRSATLCAIARE